MQLNDVGIIDCLPVTGTAWAQPYDGGTGGLPSIASEMRDGLLVEQGGYRVEPPAQMFPFLEDLLASRKRATQLQASFRTLREAWRTETRFASSASALVSNRSYLRIIALGLEVVPLLLKDLAAGPEHWSAALQALTGENPVPAESAGDLEAQRQAWLAWGRANGYSE